MYVGKPSKVMVTMTTSTANHTPPRHPPTPPNISQPSLTRKVSTQQKSDVQRNPNEQSDNSKILRDNPTKTPTNLPTAAADDPPVDDDDPNRTFVQEWKDFQDEFNTFCAEFVPFHNKYASPNTATRSNDANASHLDRRVYDDADCAKNDGETSAKQRQVFEEFDIVNHQFSQLLDNLENNPQNPFRLRLDKIFRPYTQPNRTTSNPQQTAPPPAPPIAPPHSVITGLAPPAPDPEPTRALGNISTPQSAPTTIPKEKTTVTCNCIPPQLPPPAPDPDVNMVYDGASLWPPPRPAVKTTPFKKKSPTKYTIARRPRGKDSLRPP